MKKNKNTQVFLDLVKAGLWEQDVMLSSYGEIDFDVVYKLAEEQSVVGLVAVGLEHVVDVKVPQFVALKFAGVTLQLEQRNMAMNVYIANLIELLRKQGVYTLLVKGQGVAQCYERPMWRTSGDVDLLLNDTNYKKAKQVLIPIASEVKFEYEYNQHIGMHIDCWEVELHGSLRGGLWKRLDQAIDDLQKDVFYGGNVRSWMNNKTQVFLLRPDEDVVYVFAHLLQHFFKGGISLRQICDWCRLLWIYHTAIDEKKLRKRIEQMGVKSEWNTFASLAINHLGLPPKAIPYYSSDKKWHQKGNRIVSMIIETKNLISMRNKPFFNSQSFIVRKVRSFWRHTLDDIRFFSIFPLDSIKVWFRMLLWGIKDIIVEKTGRRDRHLSHSEWQHE